MMDFTIPANQANQPAPAQIKLRLSLLGFLPPKVAEDQVPALDQNQIQVQNPDFSNQVIGYEIEARPKPWWYHVWHGFLNLIIIITSTIIFTWFGPDATYAISQGWERVMAPAKTQATSQVAQNVSNQSGLPGYWQKFNTWVGGLTVTPVAGQSATEPKVAEVVVLPTPTPMKYQPAYDATLPEGNWLVIPRIGVRSELQKNADFEKALDRGLWQVPDFGDPGSTDMPMIVAGHRYGWDWWWKSDYWKYNSFYLLPNLQPGDRVEVISDHRKWIYEIYAAEEGTEISDYSGDLILYTCKHLKSPVRFFRYARLVDPTSDSQKSK